MTDRVRRRIPANVPETEPQVSEESPGLFRQGARILEDARKARKDAEKKKADASARRFFLKKGEECEIIILDKSLEQGIAFYEHGIFDPVNKTMDYHICTKEYGRCEYCEAGDNSYYVLYLTALVLKPFTVNKDKPDERVINHSKMLLPLKLSQIEKFKELQDAALSQGKGLRGMYMVMRRSNLDTAFRIGEPIVLEGGKIFDIIPEEELVSEYGHEPIINKDGKVIRTQDYDITPFDYRKLFVKPEAAESSSPRRRKARPGSDQEAQEEFGSEEQSAADQPSDGDTEGGLVTEADPSAVHRRSAVIPTEDIDPLEDGGL